MRCHPYRPQLSYRLKPPSHASPSAFILYRSGEASLSRTWGFRLDGNIHRHPEITARRAEKTPADRRRLVDVASNGNLYQIQAADRAVGWIVRDPPGPRYIDVGPSVRRPGANYARR